jgi:hypothetical protein
MSCRHPFCPDDECVASPDALFIWVVHTSHTMDVGFEETRLFRTWEGADRWRREEGYKPFPIHSEFGFSEDVWYRPARKIWDDLVDEEDDPVSWKEMEAADIYLQEVKP